MAPLPQANVWVPRTLLFWQMTISSGGTVKRELMREPGHSLKRWPGIEEAVGDYLFGSPWLVL